MFTMSLRPEIQLPPTPMVWVDSASRWAYKVVESAEITQTELDKLGSDGWELTAILSRKTDAVYYFKRLAS